jgi:hypothetical protein
LSLEKEALIRFNNTQARLDMLPALTNTGPKLVARVTSAMWRCSSLACLNVPVQTPNIHSVATTFSSEQAVHLLRGGAETVNLARTGMHLSAMSSYALVSSLLLGSALYLFAITPLLVDQNDKSKETRVTRWATSMFAVIVSLCIVTSLHTAISFNVMTLYANTALGQGLDQQFLQFWNAPTIMGLRRSAFRSFAAAIQTFQVSFGLSVFLKTNGKHRWVATSLATIVMVLSAVKFWSMVGLASQLIFANT